MAKLKTGKQSFLLPDKPGELCRITNVIAEELGTDVSAIRVVSFKKI